MQQIFMSVYCVLVPTRWHALFSEVELAPVMKQLALTFSAGEAESDYIGCGLCPVVDALGFVVEEEAESAGGSRSN